MPAGAGADARPKVDGIVRIRPDFARQLSLGDAEVQILVHGTDANHARIIQGYAQGAVGQWAARQAAEGPSGRRRAGGVQRPALVQRGQRQPLLSGARPDRAGHDADRRHAHRAGHGPRMGARHARGAVRHAGARRRDPAGQDDPVFRAGHDRAGAVPPRRASFCSTFRSAARSRCWPARRCCICWWRWASGC